MPEALELFREGRTNELWQKYCRFIDLDMEQFMAIQNQLLLEQLELLKRCELGVQLMRGAQPLSLEEFLKQVPITTYADYAPHLPEQREDALPEKPLLWQRTSGRSSRYSYKWVPVSKRLYRDLGDYFMALLTFASCRGRGDVVLEEGDKFLYGLAPPPYASGCWAHRAADEGIFSFLPPIEKAEGMTFQGRIEEGFKFAGASLTEKTIWQAIENSGFAYVDWMARKETQEGHILHIYLELKNGQVSEKEIAATIDIQLRLMKEDYAYMVEELGFKLLRVTLLPGGAFQEYVSERQAAGADLVHLKPPHINPSDDVLHVLLGSSKKIPATI